MNNERCAVLLLGLPLSGKSALARRILDKYGVPCFSVRSWFEPMRGKIKLPAIGKMLDDETVSQAAEEFLKKYQLEPVVLFDGYPAICTQLMLLQMLLSTEKRQMYCIILQENYNTCLQRCLERRVCFKCDGGANPIVNGLLKCPICGSATSRRPDDNAEEFQKRWKRYNENLTMLKTTLKKMDCIFVTVNDLAEMLEKTI